MKVVKILVVDDLPTNRKLLRQILLKISGFTVIEAKDGREAISLFNSENPDLILMDINMPGMGGHESTSEIKKISGDTYIPIIFVTALSAESALSDSLSSGGDDFVSKPFDADVLKSKINAHLRIRELNNQLSLKNDELKRMNNNLVREQELIEHFFNSTLKQSFLDKSLIDFHMSSMSTFNGDVFLVARSPKGGLYVVMGDFTGHGLTAAMGTIPVAMIFFKMVAANSAIKDIARELNDQLYTLMPVSMFFAATLLELNAQGSILTTWMGGMPECYLVGENGVLKDTIQSKHMPLGILRDSSFDSATEIHNVINNDKLYLYSDGVIEASRPDGEMFGSERLKHVITSSNNNRIEKVIREVNEFCGTTEQSDDITLVELSCVEIPRIDEVEDAGWDNKHTLPWVISISLSSDDMRNTDPVSELSEIIGSFPVFQKHKGIIEVLLYEIYFNALDYSILGLGDFEKNTEEEFEAYYALREKKLKDLADASIKFDLTYSSTLGYEQVVICIKDNGCGYQGHEVDMSNSSLHGRGLDIVNSICDKVVFSDKGRMLEVTYKI